MMERSEENGQKVQKKSGMERLKWTLQNTLKVYLSTLTRLAPYIETNRILTVYLQIGEKRF